jgi:branched-chain amino acid transport system permease protein
MSTAEARRLAPRTALQIRPPVPLGQVLVALFLLAYPLVATPFWTVQVGAQSLQLGIIALSLMFLGGYGGMVSLAQLTVAGAAGYAVAIFGVSNLGLGWPWWIVIPLALAIATSIAALIGLIAMRTAGIYTIMITLAIGMALFYLAQQNYSIFNGFNGFSQVAPPDLFGVDWRAPLPHYYLSLGVAALCYSAVVYLARSTFGLTLQAIRDNARRMRALGYDVNRHRVMGYAIAGFIAALGGVLQVWYNTRISPGTISLTPLINILIIAVLGGMRHPIGPFIGAVVFVLLQNFAIDLIDRERFNTLIGAVFLAAVLFSPDGVLGLWDRVKTRLTAPESPRLARRQVGKGAT